MSPFDMLIILCLLYAIATLGCELAKYFAFAFFALIGIRVIYTAIS